jgi:alpha-glucosidase
MVGYGRDDATDDAMSGTDRWWRRASSIYQVYPATFSDANGDGTGDLDGIRSRLPHLERLGVDAVWLSPIYPSGGVDAGYDVTDFVDVDPAYGDLDAFDTLVAHAHARGLRVLLDFVPNHTSDRHPWFVESASSRGSPKRDWYVWRDPAPGGGPPNAWESRFGGSAWRWEPATGQYVLHGFYERQIDLNWENADVRLAVTDAMRWWLDRGVDGFRLDVIHRLSKGEDLENGPRIHEFVRGIRDAVGPEALLLGEVWLFDLREVVRYLAPGELDLAFPFPFAFAPWNARAIATVIEDVLRRWATVNAWPCWHIANHDMPRPATRWGSRAVRAAAVLQLTLPGAAIMYQGDEIGMADGHVPPDRIRDRIGRDGCRTPMRWDQGPNAGFCPAGVEPWLPVGTEPPEANVAAQEHDPDSVLALYRRLLQLRRTSPALAAGSFEILEVGDGHLVFERREARERLVVMVNMADEPRDIAVDAGDVVIDTARGSEGSRVGGVATMGPNAALVVRSDPDG